ncbi:uncharacterized serine-rich protein C215.13-like [Leptopilina heterotoma]|uniref:uncharacterized serine-rich protein C215.13-like n=1 Tax=Leptopilina heterotoma TaxID=63436 RepID=UPI001CA8154C|nr:uncharacterized serine-rich protein C215.13-like [Leptopilina heterotoma]
MLRIFVFITTLIVVNADSTLSGFSPSDDGFKSYDYGNRNADRYSRGSTKYYLASGSSPGHINSLSSSSYPSSTIYSDASQGESQSIRNYQSVDNSYLSDAPTTISSYTRERPYALSNSDYTSSLVSQSDYTGNSNSQSGFSGRTDYESSAPVSDYTGSATQQFTVGTSYRGSSLDNYPSSQDTSSLRGFVGQSSSSPSSSSSSSSSSSANSGFVSSPTYSADSTSNRQIYTGSGFKALDTSGYRNYYPTSGTREFLTSATGKHRGQVISGKYPVYENYPSQDAYTGNEIDYSQSSPHVYSVGNYKRDNYNSPVSPLHSGFSAANLNYLSSNGGVKSAYPFAGLKPQSMLYSGAQKSSGPISIPFGGGHGGDGRIIVGGGSQNFGSYSSSPNFMAKGHGSYLVGNGAGKFIIMKDHSSANSHHSASAGGGGGQIYSSSPLIGGSYKTTRNADYGTQGAASYYTPSFAGGSSPYSSRFISRGGNPFSAFLGAS